jgi:acid phosphatase
LAASPDDVLCVGENNWPEDKRSRREHITKDYRIVLMVGDDLGDFVSMELDLEKRFAVWCSSMRVLVDRWVRVPNASYRSWGRLLGTGAFR